jgi:hypothetical protein
VCEEHLPAARIECWEKRELGFHYVFSDQAALVFLDIECDLVTLGEGFEPGHGDGREMHEHILAVFLGDETIALTLVKPFNSPFSHSRTSLRKIPCPKPQVSTSLKGAILCDETDPKKDRAFDHTGKTDTASRETTMGQVNQRKGGN